MALVERTSGCQLNPDVRERSGSGRKQVLYRFDSDNQLPKIYAVSESQNAKGKYRVESGILLKPYYPWDEPRSPPKRENQSVIPVVTESCPFSEFVEEPKTEPAGRYESESYRKQLRKSIRAAFRR